MSGRVLGRSALAGLAAAVATRVARTALGTRVRPDDPRWTRTNHRGDPVSLLEGPAVVAGLLAGLATAGLGTADGRPGARFSGARHSAVPWRAALAAGIAVAGGAVLGLVDDLTEDQEHRRKGLRGHLGALARGELTTGGLKVLGIGATSLVAAALAPPPGLGAGASASCGRGVGRAFDVVTSGALIAVCANLVNLFDLRPGRALKVGLAVAPATLAAAVVQAGAQTSAGAARGTDPATGAGAVAASVSGAVVGAAGAALGADLRERDMLGDGGANALGAALGAAAVLGCSRRSRLVLLAGAAGLTLASERISFTRVIERSPVLRRIDGWGRRPSVSSVSSGPPTPSAPSGPAPDGDPRDAPR